MTPYPRPLSEAERSAIVQRYLSGTSQAALSRQYRVTRERIIKLVLASGHPMRTRRPRPKIGEQYGPFVVVGTRKKHWGKGKVTTMYRVRCTVCGLKQEFQGNVLRRRKRCPACAPGRVARVKVPCRECGKQIDLNSTAWHAAVHTRECERAEARIVKVTRATVKAMKSVYDASRVDLGYGLVVRMRFGELAAQFGLPTAEIARDIVENRPNPRVVVR
jgi:hypothetical protein